MDFSRLGISLSEKRERRDFNIVSEKMVYEEEKCALFFREDYFCQGLTSKHLKCHHVKPFSERRRAETFFLLLKSPFCPWDSKKSCVVIFIPSFLFLSLSLSLSLSLISLKKKRKREEESFAIFIMALIRGFICLRRKLWATETGRNRTSFIYEFFPSDSGSIFFLIEIPGTKHLQEGLRSVNLKHKRQKKKLSLARFVCFACLLHVYYVL